MDFDLTDDQRQLSALARRIFSDRAGEEHIAAAENSIDRIDRVAWKHLADAGLLGIGIAETDGGIGLGLVEACLVLEEQGRHVLPLPLWPTLVLAAAPIARFGTAEQRGRWLPDIASGNAFAAAALAEAGAGDALRPAVRARYESGRWLLTGSKPAVPAGTLADVVVVSARHDGGVALFLLDPHGAGVQRTPTVTTNRELHAQLELTEAPAEPLGDVGEGNEVVRWLHERALVGLAALQLGVAEEALRRAAAYLSQRIQFGVPVGSFQGPQLRAADGYIDVEAMRCTLWQAAWLLDQGRPAAWEVRSAKWWAAEAGQRVVHAVQHLHGGIGADVEYPIHRYFLWGKQIENTLGSASSHLAALGRMVAER